jgi:8-amino-7-oxononanoate synthase
MTSSGRELWIDRELAGRERDGLLRRTSVYPRGGPVLRVDGRDCLNLSSNDYLNLANDPRLAAAAAQAAETLGTGATASRLVTGTWECHDALERRLAAFKGYPAAILFGSGYLTNLGTIPALVERDDHVFADRLSHASILDGAVLSRARLVRVAHNDPDHLRDLLARTPAKGKRLVVTESVFSMDGDLAPLADLAAVCDEAGAMLMVDEAHATGVHGPGGAGLVRQLALEPLVNVSMATLSKALGGYGGFVACSPALREWLVNRGRAFVYTTALPPATVAAASAALDVLAERPDAGAELLRRAGAFRRRLRAAGLDTGRSESQIVPVLAGDTAKAMALAAALRSAGILAVAIRPPTVPAGSARIRCSVTLGHSEEMLSEAAETIVRCAREVGLP